MELDFYKALLVTLGTAFLLVVGWRSWETRAERLFFCSFLIGYWFYSGLASSLKSVPWSFLAIYFSVLIGVMLGFSSFKILPKGYSPASSKGIDATFNTGAINNNWYKFIFIYLALLSIKELVWPDFRLANILNLGAPNLVDVFRNRFSGESEPVVATLLRYFELLMLPFFYIALYTIRNRLGLFILVLSVPLLVDYIATGYVSRGSILSDLLIAFFAIWFFRPRHRFLVGSAAAIAAPLLFIFLDWYSIVRLGGEFKFSGLIHSMSTVLDQELSFVVNRAVPLFNAGKSVDLGQYFTWFVTVPIPKVITGPIEGARINNEISEIILNRPVGSPNWYVVLPALIGEAIYVFGPVFAWLHGFMVGLVICAFGRFVGDREYLAILGFFIMSMIFYELNRGGFSAFWPPLINSMLLLFAVTTLGSFRTYRGKSTRALRHLS